MAPWQEAPSSVHLPYAHGHSSPVVASTRALPSPPFPTAHRGTAAAVLDWSALNLDLTFGAPSITTAVAFVGYAQPPADSEGFLVADQFAATTTSTATPPLPVPLPETITLDPIVGAPGTNSTGLYFALRFEIDLLCLA